MSDDIFGYPAEFLDKGFNFEPGCNFAQAPEVI